MNLKEAFGVITYIEEHCDTDKLRLGDFSAWPLVRLSLWTELATPRKPHQNKLQRLRMILQNTSRQEITNALIDRSLTSLPVAIKNQFSCKRSNIEILVIGRPNHFQSVAGFKEVFDRVLDPIMHVLKNLYEVEKLIIGTPLRSKFQFPAKRLRIIYKGPIHELIGLPESGLVDLLAKFDIDTNEFLKKLNHTIHIFWKGFYTFQHQLTRYPSLRHIFVATWYSPDMMGLIASAQRRGIPVTDVQHGVQGEFHGMYAGFTRVPEHGYEFLPSWFWCWGDSAVKDIMSSSRNRSHHIAISGGYPWIDYWRMLQEHRSSIVFCSSRNKPRCQLLVTLRGPYGDHTERVPDFLVDFLRKDHPNTLVVFRTHPNDPAALNYLRSRLKKPLKTSFVVTSFDTDLYTSLSQSTHLLTAYSTVCYEASIFDVPTLLYGKDALEIFQQSISDGTFHWTSGTLSDLERFLEKPQTIGEPRNSYMLSSLDLAQKTAKYLIDGDHKSK